MRTTWRWLPWLGLVLVALAVLVVGTQRSSHPTLQERTMHIAGLVRCPVCEGQSAAESQAPASVQIRDQIQHELAAGESQSQILAGLAAAYGTGILEKPEARGAGLLLWVLPVLAVVAAIAGLALAFARWRPRREDRVTAADRALVDEALRHESSPGADGLRHESSPGADGLRHESSPGADVFRHESSPGADALPHESSPGADALPHESSPGADAGPGSGSGAGNDGGRQRDARSIDDGAGGADGWYRAAAGSDGG